MGTNRLKLKGKLQFTFHYGSILIGHLAAMNHHFNIYIPLWFYSNLVSANMEQPDGNLHSTMVLF